MKPITANLKILYQCPRMWLYHFFGILGILTMTMQIYGYGGLPLWLILAYGAGIGVIIRETLRKPFTFCLPGHTKSAQKLLFLVWLAMTIIYSLLFLMSTRSNYAFFIGSIGLLSLTYCLGFIVIIPKGRFITAATFLTIGNTYPKISKTIEINPWLGTLICGILSYLIYRAVGRKDNVRRLCVMPWLEYFTTDVAKQNRYMRERMHMKNDHSRDRASELAGSFFSKRIMSNRNSRPLAHLWGQVYLTIGSLIITRWRGILIAGLCILIYLNCLPLIYPPQREISQQGPGISWIFIILASAMGGGIFVTNRFDIFLLIGRKECLWRSLVFLFSVIFVISGFMAAYALLSNLLSGRILPILFEGRSYLPSIGWILPVVPVFMIPFLGGLVIMFRESGIILKLFMIGIAVAASLYLVDVMENTPFMIDLLIILSAVAITWGFHLAVLYYSSVKRSLC